MTSIKLLREYCPKEIGIYIHIPFCRKKCEYCDFLSFPINDIVSDDYINALIKELGTEPYPSELKSIYFGGGTPSLLTTEQIEKIINYVNKLFISATPEITIEVNPDDITESWVKEIKNMGINRISIGVQSFNDKDLKYLGRRHNAEKAKKSCEIISAYFNNWSLDLIFGIPFQDKDMWEKILEMAVKLNPSHISTYNLTFEKGTPLYKDRIKDKQDDDFCLELYKYVEIYLKGCDFEHYEISNFAKKGYKCIHNLIYWYNEYYLGLGAGAFSFLGNVRCSNFYNVEKYIEVPGEKEEKDYLTEKEIKVETLIQHFRLSEGIHEKKYQNRFSKSMNNDFGPTLKNLIKRGLLEYNQGNYKPTPQGFYLNNEIGRELLKCLE